MKILKAALAALIFVSLGAQGATAMAADPRVELDTNQGRIVIELDPAKAPKTVDNFLAYVKKGHYNGTVFHRVIGSFMIQGGGFTPDMKEKPTGKPIPLEARNGLSNLRGTVAMARTPDPNSATAQFFINVADNSRLDAGQAADGHGYAVFGKVVEGMDVVDKIRGLATGRRGFHSDVPLEPVIIQSAKILP